MEVKCTKFMFSHVDYLFLMITSSPPSVQSQKMRILQIEAILCETIEG